MTKPTQSQKYNNSQQNTPEDTISNGLESTSEQINNIKSNSELVETKPIHDTPFTAVRMDDKWFLTMGKYRLTNQLGTEAECIAESADVSWNRLLQVIQIMINENSNQPTK